MKICASVSQRLSRHRADRQASPASAMRPWAGRKIAPARCDLEVTNKAIAKARCTSEGGYRFRQKGPSYSTPSVRASCLPHSGYHHDHYCGRISTVLRSLMGVCDRVRLVQGLSYPARHPQPGRPARTRPAPLDPAVGLI